MSGRGHPFILPGIIFGLFICIGIFFGVDAYKGHDIYEATKIVKKKFVPAHWESDISTDEDGNTVVDSDWVDDKFTIVTEICEFNVSEELFQSLPLYSKVVLKGRVGGITGAVLGWQYVGPATQLQTGPER